MTTITNDYDSSHVALQEDVIAKMNFFEGVEKYYRSNYPRINPEAKKVWVKALRSGKYEQGFGMLKTPDNNFCCLGVYCDITEVPSHLVRREVVYEGIDQMVEIEVFGDNKGSASHTLLPRTNTIPYLNPADGALGFRGNGRLFSCKKQNPDGSEGEGHAWSLPDLNDNGGFTFAQIADIIDYFL